jgi:hypothetical protein
LNILFLIMIRLWIFFYLTHYWKTTAKSSNFYSKTSEEVQIALYRLPLHQSTQIRDGSPNLHMHVYVYVQWVHRLENASRARIFRNPMSSGSLHSLLVLNLLKCGQEAYWPDIILDIVETKFLSSVWPSNQGRREPFASIEWANLPVFAASHFPCHSLSKTDLAKPWQSTGSLVHQLTHYSQALRETGSIVDYSRYFLLWIWIC